MESQNIPGPLLRLCQWLKFRFQFFIAFPEIAFDIWMEYPGSPLTWEILDESSMVGMRFLIVRPFWDEILFGILGLFCAWGLKKRETLAWKLGVFWGVMMLVAGIAIGLSELFIGEWPTVCMVTIVYSIIGVIALSCLFFAKRDSDLILQNTNDTEVYP